MKYSLLIVGLIFSFLMFSCFNNKKGKEVENKKCLPAYILIIYLGEDNKPTYPLVIRTDEKDTSYLKFIGSEKEKLDKNGFTTSKEYIRIHTVKPETYYLLKSYIVAHNSHKDRTIFNASNNTMKVILSDQCDSVMYAVDKAEKGYFSKMIDTLNLKNDDELRSYINYYHQIQEWNGSN